MMKLIASYSSNFVQKIKDPYFKLIFLENFNLPIKLSEDEKK